MGMAMKKLINKPEALAWELLEGLAAAYGDTLRLAGNHILTRRHPKEKGKVQIVFGQGSGHEPGFEGHVGYGMHDVEVAGNIFACAGPDRILEGIQEAWRTGGGGEILVLVANHEGDVINNGAAVDMALAEGLDVDSVLLYDDIASAPKGEEIHRRGMAGMFFAFKAAGALAEEGADRKKIIEAVKKVTGNTRTLAVAVRPCTAPTTGRPLFELADDELIIGPGVHGEAGPEGPAKMMSADEVMDTVLDRLVEDGGFKTGDEFLVILNGCGSTTLMELFILFRRLSWNLGRRGMSFHRPLVGNVMTTQEMGGFSLSLCKADPEIKRLWDAPADTPYFKVCG
jgi:phosphoenolpyruvate---glycerone phosphotransferase subunit DhaK